MPSHKMTDTKIQSKMNNTGDVKMLAVVHDTGLIGTGTIKKSGKWSAELYEPTVVREYAEQLIHLCDQVMENPGPPLDMESFLDKTAVPPAAVKAPKEFDEEE